MDLTLSPEQDAVRKAVKEWVDDVVVPPSLQNDREERFPQEALDGLPETGFIGMTIPEEHGGGGAGPIGCRTSCSSRSSVAATPTCAPSAASTSVWSRARSRGWAPRSRSP